MVFDLQKILNAETVEIQEVPTVVYPISHGERKYLVLIAEFWPIDKSPTEKNILLLEKEGIFIDHPFGTGTDMLYYPTGEHFTHESDAPYPPGTISLGALYQFWTGEDPRNEMFHNPDELAKRIEIMDIIVSDTLNTKDEIFRRLPLEEGAKEHLIVCACADISFKLAQHLKQNPEYIKELRVTGSY